MKRKALYEVTSKPVATLRPGASIESVIKFVQTAERHSAAAFMRKRCAQIERHARRLARGRGVATDVRATAQRCLEAVQGVRHLLGKAALTGEGIAAAMAAALVLGDEWQSLIVEAQLGAVVGARMKMTETGTANVRARNQRVQADADAAALKRFEDWRLKRSGQLTGLGTDDCLKRFIATVHPPPRLKDRLHRLLSDKTEK